MKHLIFCVLLTLSAISSTSQTVWGKVSPEQFTIRHYAYDTTANAVVLLDSEYVTVSLTEGIVYERLKRIQIFNREGFAYGTVKIPYYSYGNALVFTQLEAQTINKDETGKLQITKLRDNAFVDEKESDYISEKKFAFANVQEGSILEYRYKIATRSYGDISDWMFQSDLPTLRSSVTIKTPEYFHYTSVPRGSVLLSAKNPEPYNEWVSNLNVIGTITYYMMHDVPALKTEAYLTTINDYLARLSFPLNSINIPRQKVRSFADSWHIIVNNLMRSPYFGGRLDEMLGDNLDAAKQATKDLKSKDEKARAIYSLVTSKMKWNGWVSLYSTNNRLSKSYSDGNGNSADINLLLISMLRAAGVDANPVIISTRDHGMIIEGFPREQQFNNVIVCAETETGSILLDAAGLFKPYGLINQTNLNGRGLKIIKSADDPQYSYTEKWIDINSSKNSNTTLITTIEIGPAGFQKTKSILTATDYPAVAFRNDLEKDSIKESLKKNFTISDEYELKDEQAENARNAEQKLKLNITLDKKETSTEYSTLYLNPFPIKFISDNPFKLSQRAYPVDYGFPFQQNIITTVVIPQNCKVSELPKSQKIKLNDGSASFTFTIGQADNNIQINSSLKINKATFLTDEYEDLKALYAKMIDIYNTSIVLEQAK